MTLKNTSASVRARLLNLAKASGVDFNQILIRHAIERMLFRLATSQHMTSFVLKGAMLFTVWRGSPHRPTQDLDLLGFGDPSPERLVIVFKELCTLRVEDDGWHFAADSVSAETIRTIDEYGGSRVHVTGMLGSAIARLQIDIGFGDAITPAATDANYPVLLHQPVPRLRIYPPATVVAEKTEAIATLGMLNTRLKDYFDLKFLAEQFEFDGAELVMALRATFDRRETALPNALPTGLTAAFAQDAVKQRQWTAFADRVGGAPATLPEVVASVVEFLTLPLRAAYEEVPFTLRWRPRGPWN